MGMVRDILDIITILIALAPIGVKVFQLIAQKTHNQRMINLSELRTQEYNLSPSRYFEKEVQVEGLDIDKEMALLAEKQQRFDASQKQLTRLLNSFK